MKNRKTRSAMRRMLFTLALVLVVAVASVGGTIAWLTDKTDTVTNTFTVGDVDIELDETTGTNYKVIPGVNIRKDPKVTVKAGSEACWLFVKVVKSTNWNSKLSFTIADGWTELTEGSGIYWRKVEDLTADTATDKVFAVLANNTITVSDALTKDEITADNKPTLAFTAYAIQQEGFNDTTKTEAQNAAAAWAEASK